MDSPPAGRQAASAGMTIKEVNIDDLKKLNIPKNPGCYLFKDAKGKIIYVGKASDLRSRVSSYWRQSANHSPAKHAMMKQIAKVDWIETDSEIEALLLESNLIKKHAPQFNVLMRDDKRYAYIKVSTEESWPRIYLTRKLDHSGRFFGPFISTVAVRETLRVLRRIWPYRSCRSLPKRACLYYNIGKCPGMCEERVTRAEYLKIIKQIILFLEGKKSTVIKNYKLQIKNYEKTLKKEKDESKREEIQNEVYQLQGTLDNMQNVLRHSNIISLSDKYAADVVEVAKLLSLPRVPERIEGYDISNIFGGEATGSMVVFMDGEPEKSEYRKFKIRIGSAFAKASSVAKALADRSADKQGDVQMLTEMLERRFKRSITNYNLQITNKEEKESWRMPDLIIIDGAKAQLNAAIRVIKKIRKEIPIIAISKGEGLRSATAPDKLFFPGEKKPLELPLASPALHLIKRVRDEAHRFAIGYHRKLRNRKFFE